VLGPEFITIDSTDVDFTESIQDYLAKKKFKEFTQKSYFSEDGFLHFENQSKNSDMLIELGKFYRELKVSESYTKLARIPFTSIISLSPDDLIVQAYTAINKDCVFRRYKDEGFDDGPPDTSKLKPLIYNLVGHYENPMELVFTFDNLFMFLNKIFQDTIFQNVRKHIIQAHSFLFLGFNYDKWYLKLIFFLLNKFREHKNVTRNAVFDYIKNEKDFSSKIEYYKASYNLNFSQENEKKFIDKLFEECRVKGILTDINKVQDVDSNKLTEKTDNRYRILFLGSSPIGKLTLKIGEEFFDIEKVLNKDFYELLKPKFGFQKNDIQAEVNTKFPNLIYFTCHGTPEGELILSTDKNKPDKLALQDLKDIIENLVNVHKQITCIVFSACKSEIQAKEISGLIPYCVGMSEPVSEKVGFAFTEGFFQGFILDKQNIQFAFNNAVQVIKNHGDNEISPFFNIPVLYENGKKYTKEKNLQN
jgi:hypothetical protein